MNVKAAAGIVIALAFVGVFLVAILPSTIVWPAAAPGGTTIGSAMWEGRAFEVLLQGIILLGGVIAILLLLGSRRAREVTP